MRLLKDHEDVIRKALNANKRSLCGGTSATVISDIQSLLDEIDALRKESEDWKKNYEEACASRDKALARVEDLEAFSEGVLLGAEATRKEYNDLRAVVRERYGPSGTKILDEVVSLRKRIEKLRAAIIQVHEDETGPYNFSVMLYKALEEDEKANERL